VEDWFTEQLVQTEAPSPDDLPVGQLAHDDIPDLDHWPAKQAVQMETPWSLG